MPRTRLPYPAALRQQILELAHAGRTPAELSREFDVTAQTISNWVVQDARDRGAALPGKESLGTPEREELVRLRRKLRQVQQERGILVKATAWFAARHDKQPGRDVQRAGLRGFQLLVVVLALVLDLCAQAVKALAAAFGARQRHVAHRAADAAVAVVKRVQRDQPQVDQPSVDECVAGARRVEPVQNAVVSCARRLAGGAS